MEVPAKMPFPRGHVVALWGEGGTVHMFYDCCCVDGKTEKLSIVAV